MTFELQQIVDGEWSTVAAFDDLSDATAELETVKADSYYSKSQWRLFTDACPN